MLAVISKTKLNKLNVELVEFVQFVNFNKKAHNAWNKK